MYDHYKSRGELEAERLTETYVRFVANAYRQREERRILDGFRETILEALEPYKAQDLTVSVEMDHHNDHIRVDIFISNLPNLHRAYLISVQELARTLRPEDAFMSLAREFLAEFKLYQNQFSPEDNIILGEE